jgi:hypothetical protein
LAATASDNAGVVHPSASPRYGVLIVPEPDSVVRHPPAKRLLHTAFSSNRVEWSLVKTDCTGAIFAPQVASKRESHFRDARTVWLIEVSDLNAVVCVDSRTARNVQSVFAIAIVIKDELAADGVVRSAKAVKPNHFAGLTSARTKVASRYFLNAHPPLLFKEGNVLARQFIRTFLDRLYTKT